MICLHAAFNVVLEWRTKKNDGDIYMCRGVSLKKHAGSIGYRLRCDKRNTRKRWTWDE